MAAPCLFIDYGVLLFVGPIGNVDEHDCAGTVVAFGLEQAFTLTTDAGRHDVRMAVVPSGKRRAVAGGGGRMGVCLVDPGMVVGPIADTDDLLDCVRRVGDGGNLALWPAFRASIGLSPRAPNQDARVERVLAELRQPSDTATPVAELAAGVGLSASRLEHLFTSHVGCPIRSYRTWHRFRAAAAAFRTGGAITTAAHAAGFYDSAQFARTFRQSFGLPPSAVLSENLVVRLVDDVESAVARDSHA